MARIGVFDTGFGGRYVAQQLGRLRPHDQFVAVDDRQHIPYGSKTDDEIFELTNNAIQPLLDADCDIIIIACNTATTVAIDRLRAAHPDVPFIGFEPMVRTAAQLTRTGKIAILATPATLRSARYRELKSKWASDCVVIEPDCSTWATRIESNSFDPSVAEQCITELVDHGVDTVALACTHYLYLGDHLQAQVGSRATIIQPLEAVDQQISHILMDVE